MRPDSAICAHYSVLACQVSLPGVATIGLSRPANPDPRAPVTRHYPRTAFRPHGAVPWHGQPCSRLGRASRCEGQTKVQARYMPGSGRGRESGVPEQEPGHGPPAAAPPAPPGGQASHQLQPPPALRVSASRAEPRHPAPAAVGDLDPDQPVPCLHRDRDRPPGRPETLCSALLLKSSPAGPRRLRRGAPGRSTPPTKARATRARSASPASVTLSRTAAPPITSPLPGRPPREDRTRRGRAQGHARPTQRRMSSWNASRRAMSVETDGSAHRSHRPDVVRYMSVDPATRRPAALYGDTRRDNAKRPA